MPRRSAKHRNTPLRREKEILHSDGIRANTVAPGVIDTTRDWTQYPHFANGYGDRIQEIPVRRVGHVEEIADAWVYLAGAGFVTGQVLYVCGGMTVGVAGV